MKKLLLTYLLFITLFNVYSQLTYVPDDAFEAYIENTFPSANNGTVNDNYVLTAGIQNISIVHILGSNYQIFDYTGLQDFTGIFQLKIMAQNVPTIDLSLYPNIDPWAGYLSVELQSNNLLQTVIMPQNQLNIKIQYNTMLENIIFQESNMFAGLGSVVESNASLEVFDISNTSGVINGAAMNIELNPQLKCVNLKNGGCANWLNVWIEGNSELDPDPEFESLLKCVEVDNPSYAQLAFFWDYNLLDPTTYIYSTNCSCNLGMEQNILGSLTAYPNPTSGNINITFPEELIDNHFTLLNQLGKIIEVNKILHESVQLETNHLQNGVYFIHVGSKSIGRFVVMR
jgi:hypothetical protein